MAYEMEDAIKVIADLLKLAENLGDLRCGQSAPPVGSV